jgi:GNAT superfamily N-acetyltransferase
VLDALTRSGAFNAEEVRVAMDMFDAGLAGDYTVLVADANGTPAGYACVGRASLTERSWYEYWMCVRPDAQGSGVGQALQRQVEDIVHHLGGERLVLETSGRPDYARARRFYERAGFSVQGRIPDFYRPGDDCVIYCKRLDIFYSPHPTPQFT